MPFFINQNLILLTWKVENLVKSQSGHAEKPFAGHMWSLKGFLAWPLCDSNVSKLKMLNHVLFKTYGFAIREWLFGMGTIFSKQSRKEGHKKLTKSSNSSRKFRQLFLVYLENLDRQIIIFKTLKYSWKT